MNTKEYIESGILEQYVLGAISLQEKQEVECMSHIYPEIATELTSIQTAMEALAVSMKKEPPAELRNKILGSLSELSKSEMPKVSSDIVSETVTSKVKDNIVPMRLNVMRMAAALFFITALGLAFLLFNSKKVNQEKDLQLANIQKELASKDQALALQNTHLDVMQNPAFKKIELAGIKEKSPDSKVQIYWNKTSSEVYLSVAKLPAPASDKQYQLWAIADGKPVDMGMLSENSIDTIFQKMKTIGNAQAFAITLEKKGGVPSPTLTEMYVMGGV